MKSFATTGLHFHVRFRRGKKTKGENSGVIGDEEGEMDDREDGGYSLAATPRGCRKVGCVEAGCGDCCLGLATLVLLLANSKRSVCGMSGSNRTP